jgi:hypothetical protein
LQVCRVPLYFPYFFGPPCNVQRCVWMQLFGCLHPSLFKKNTFSNSGAKTQRRQCSKSIEQGKNHSSPPNHTRSARPALDPLKHPGCRCHFNPQIHWTLVPHLYHKWPVG